MKLLRRQKRNLWIILTCIFAVLFIAFTIGTSIALKYETVINVFFDTENSKTSGSSSGDTEYFKSAYATSKEVQAANVAICEEVEAEGAVLLLNRNNALPLDKGSKITGLGKATVQLVTGGTGSGSVATTGTYTFKTAMEDAGFVVNGTMWDFYSRSDIQSKYSLVLTSNSDLNTTGDYIGRFSDIAVNEVPMSEYSSAEWDSVSSYGDAAIVMLSRNCGEGADLPAINGKEGAGNILELTPEEQGLLSKAASLKASGKVGKIVVLLNSSYQLELDFLEPELCGVDYKIDACMWIGGTGESGINAVADILAGNVNPSGKLVNTYCYDNLTSPAVQNMYTSEYANAAAANLTYGKGNRAYVTYEEGIYVGYRYYETRYEDYVLGNAKVGSYDYSTTVAYPFGYGLSYSDFSFSNLTLASEDDDSLTFTVDVINHSSVAGKEVVAIYMQSPYTQYDKTYLVEKASIELVGYTKVEVGANDTVTATVVVDKTELRAYDSNHLKTYILDAGNYYFSVGNGAHEALNNVLAKKSAVKDSLNGTVDFTKMVGSYDEALAVQYTVAGDVNGTVYSISEATGATITNQFDHADLNSYGVNVTYLTRQDWIGTMPKATITSTNYVASNSGVSATDDMVTDLAVNYTKSTSGTMPAMGVDNGLKLIQFKGVTYGESIEYNGKTYTWDDLLDQLKLSDMANLIGQGYHSTYYISSITKPATKDENGPQGITASLTGGASSTAYPSSDVRAATFNVELNERMGEGYGEDAFWAGYSGVYATGANTHRTPYSGRNFEYYSEDPYLGGQTGAHEIKGIQSKGVYCYVKHFALNDQETNRTGSSVWANEQSIREIYLQPFETIVEVGGGHCVMTSFTRFGCIWAGADYNLLTNVLREEWGMDGMAITDYGNNSYMDVKIGLLAGSDIWDCSANTWSTELINNYFDDPTIVNAMRTATYRVLYTVVNSKAMNGYGIDTEVVASIPWWKATLYAIDVIFGVATVVAAGMLIATIVLNRKKSGDDGETA